MTFCVYCGAPLTDAGRCNSCGAVRVGGTWHEPAHNAVAVSGDPGTGWHPDPTGRHEGRYYVGGQPTDLIRDGGVEALDALGKQQLEQAVAEPYSPGPEGPKRRRVWFAVAAAASVLALVAGAVAAYAYLNRDQTTVDDRYLVALQQAGLSGEYNSDANAVAHGKQVCRAMEEGSPQQGMPADEVAVQYFCPQFTEGFHVLETATITGSFTLHDEKPNAYAPAIEVDGSSCTGAGGYSDVNPETPVTVKNGKGEILTTTYLEPGKGGRYMCTFSMTFEVTEGDDRYVVSVGRRGELSFTFNELKSNGVALVLG
ncbi:DUF732 domain-containing protein [Mycolicibacterium austroafricanum]|uniref:DUF732 domain-containing protein n=1 Tax=Mycolicibacterium austroafricanum TaxID=39687 RepID=A0ABT8HHY0_MYCAO|nr:DUF732 domain-containing protein [Mycolicibacterium austroafricanum]MDN4520356.1 DUF732 domain-containing protein [Mycolicibacterium austroafricanum]QRZ07761.1 DUF732 domain-containing protein [Mycolicibacterium austroafricanum]QZT69424.1 DUF732 domain-containing protein [Mycolicibacterium austroafricanum]